MPLRLYVDEDAMARAFVEGLRSRGIDVRTTAEAERVGIDDAAQRRFAAEQERTLYTFNVGDFCRLHAERVAAGRRHAGIIVVPRQRYGVGEQIRRLLRLNRERADLHDRLVFL